MGPVGLVFCNSDSCTFKRNLGANIGAFNYITASIQTYTYKKNRLNGSLLFHYYISISEPRIPDNTEEIFQRTVQMRQACASIPPIRHLSGKLNSYRLFYVAEKYKLSYCRVAKAGSTFMAQLFMTLAGIDPKFHDYGNAQTMFELPKDLTHKAMKRNSALSMFIDDKRVQLTTSFILARNPYSRLFSSYIDQIYLPNRWPETSHMVSDSKRKECGNDVTFNEFLAHIADSMLTKKSVEIHWAPIFTLCLPCETHIDIVAKQESFVEDIDFILGYSGVEPEVRELINMAASANILISEIPDKIQALVKKGQSINRGCMSEQDLARRIWTAFQIQGHIRNEDSFPVYKFENILHDELEETLVPLIEEAVVKMSLTPRQIASQRHNWQLKFWKDISSETLRNIQAAYYEDFSLFGYNIDPNKM